MNMLQKRNTKVSIGQDLLRYQSQDLDLDPYLGLGQDLLDLCPQDPAQIQDLYLL